MSVMASASYLETWSSAERLAHLLIFAVATGRLTRDEVDHITWALDDERRRRLELADMLLGNVRGNAA